VALGGQSFDHITFISALTVIFCSWFAGFFYSYIVYLIVVFVSLYLFSNLTGYDLHTLLSDPETFKYLFKIFVAPTVITVMRTITQKYIVESEQRKDTESELKNALLKLQKSNMELQQFAYAASHDLKEPLRTISSYLVLLSKRYKGQLDRDADDFIDFTVDAAKRMSLLIDNLLTYSRVQTREPKLEMIDCNKVVENVIAQLVTVIEEQKAEVRFQDLPTIYADNLQMLQLFRTSYPTV
jgi:signal transduction histidine kinase